MSRRPSARRSVGRPSPATGTPSAGRSAPVYAAARRWARAAQRGLAALLAGMVLLLSPSGGLASPESGGGFGGASADAHASPRWRGVDLGWLSWWAIGAQQYPLNGRFLMLNMHGLLFHEHSRDFQENVDYARWLGAGIIRAFATDNNTLKPWSGRRVGEQIASMAPIFRAGGVRLLVALVNNHRPVPGELADSYGFMDGYHQLLLPFYTRNWRGPYLAFVRELIATVRVRGASDVIFAWELGNELHTPQDPPAMIPFVTSMVQEIRRLDPTTPIYPGTMGVNHLEPWNIRSPVARWLYCEAPVDAYTLHAYDWVARDRQGDMPIEWDLDYTTLEPCPGGRRLPVIVEELGTSRTLAGRYAGEQQEARLEQELRQLRFVLGYPQVKGVGVWSAESPRVADRTYYDSRRGLTSFGPRADGGGSCYDPVPLPYPAERCRLEQALRSLPAIP